MKNYPLRKHDYSNSLKILRPKNENFQIKTKSDICHISAQSIDCVYPLELPPRSDAYLQSMLLSRNKKTNGKGAKNKNSSEKGNPP